MKRYLYFMMFASASLLADIEAEDLSEIYTEAIVFVIVIAVMSVGSYIISSKHAKEHAIKNRSKVEEERLKDKENIANKKSRLQELSKMHEDGILRKEELNVLKKWIYNDE